jgi:hypothetical protein
MTRREVEARIGVDSIEVLQADRAQYMSDLATLRAFDKAFDGERKAVRSVILIEIRDKMVSEGKKAPGFDLLEAEASADPRYRTWLDQATTKLATKETLDMRVQEITELINRDQALIRFATAEPR